jgi:hypothetical protein
VLRIRDVYPGSRIPDPKTATKERREKISCNIFCSHKFHKIVNYFIFEMPKKKIWANFQRIIKLFSQKIVTKLSKIWVWDPGSRKNLLQIPDPGVKKAPDPGPGSATLVSKCRKKKRGGGRDSGRELFYIQQKGGKQCSGSGSGSRSFHQHAKNLRKLLILLFVTS